MTVPEPKSAFKELSLPGFTACEPPTVPKAKDDFVKDHRKRLRQRFMRAGSEALQDYELLELVLFRAISRRDVKPLAKRLIARFGDFNRVISARPSLIAEVQGAGDAVIQELKIIEAAAHSLSRARVLHTEVLSSWSALMRH